MTNSVPQSGADPRPEYAQRLKTWKATQALHEDQHRRIGISQLVLGGVTAVLIGLALVAKVISVYWVLAPLVTIVALAVVHGRVLKARERS